MTLCVNYDSKKKLKASTGQRLSYTETSLFGAEYDNDGIFSVAHRPHMTGRGREFFARVEMRAGRIYKVT